LPSYKLRWTPQVPILSVVMFVGHVLNVSHTSIDCSLIIMQPPQYLAESKILSLSRSISTYFPQWNLTLLSLQGLNIHFLRSREGNCKANIWFLKLMAVKIVPLSFDWKIYISIDLRNNNMWMFYETILWIYENISPVLLFYENIWQMNVIRSNRIVWALQFEHFSLDLWF
jgi:hypothetical protein